MYVRTIEIVKVSFQHLHICKICTPCTHFGLDSIHSKKYLNLKWLSAHTANFRQISLLLHDRIENNVHTMHFTHVQMSLNSWSLDIFRPI